MQAFFCKATKVAYFFARLAFFLRPGRFLAATFFTALVLRAVFLLRGLAAALTVFVFAVLRLLLAFAMTLVSFQLLTMCKFNTIIQKSIELLGELLICNQN
jgi:hypothetical protein